MIGRRVQPDENGWFSDKLEPGDYVRVAPVRAADGREFTEEERAKWWTKPYWLCCAPNGHSGRLANHSVVEHEDGTITVSPSILISRGGPGSAGDKPREELYHGFLERGVWRTA